MRVLTVWVMLLQALSGRRITKLADGAMPAGETGSAFQWWSITGRRIYYSS